MAEQLPADEQEEEPLSTQSRVFNVDEYDHLLYGWLINGPEMPPAPKPKPLPALPISKIKGRLLTPEEGCGFSKVANTRIVGGQNAKIGK